MKYLLDTANIESIQKYIDILPIDGITSNPSIVKREGKVDFFNQFKTIRSIIGFDRSLHVQVTSQDCEGMLEDAQAILDHIDQSVFVKLPVTLEGLKAMKILKAKGVQITATAVYSKAQAFLALEAGADYIAPYFNRIQNLGNDPKDLIRSLSMMIEKNQYPCKILAASFKSMDQVNEAFEAGAHTATMSVDLIVDALNQAEIHKAVDVFEQDWESIYGKGMRIKNLK